MELSIIIPIYNGALFLEKLIGTITAFTFTDFECIFIDNNSTDDSLSVLDKLLDSVVFPYLILSEEKQGAGHARNTGIRKAKGEFLAFLDCDDVILPRKFEGDIRILSNQKVDFVFCRTKRIYSHGRTLLHPIDEIVSGLNTPPNLGIIWLKDYFKLQGTGSIIVKKDVVKKLGGFQVSLTGEDAFLFIKLGLLYKGFFRNEVLFNYYRHPQSTISKRNRQNHQQLIEYLKLRLNLFMDPEVQKNNMAIKILKGQICIDLLKVHCYGLKLDTKLKREMSGIFKLPFVLFNPVSLFLNRMIPNIRYNPFYQLNQKILKRFND